MSDSIILMLRRFLVSVMDDTEHRCQVVYSAVQGSPAICSLWVSTFAHMCTAHGSEVSLISQLKYRLFVLGYCTFSASCTFEHA